MKRVQKLSERYLAHTYKRQPITFLKGRGMFVWDSLGRRYLDFVGGIAVCSLGHCHPALVKAISEQAKKLMHVSNLYFIQQQAELAELLAHIVPKPIDKFFFCNSGAEMRRRFVCLTASLNDPSTASAPELQKKNFSMDFGTICANSSASSACCWMK